MMDGTKTTSHWQRIGVRSARAVILMAVLSLTATAQTSPAGGAGTPSSGAPEMLTLQDALQRAKVNSPDFRAALTDAGLAHEDKVQSRSGMLPNVNYNNGFIYTEPNGTRSGTGLYIANNGVHEYLSEGDVHQEVSLAMVADYRRAAAAEALAKARRRWRRGAWW